MSLRIVAGQLGGRRIRTPRGRATRPTREAVREAWFNALGERIEGANVVDLYAGSGALGIEALSRGAAIAHFVEADPGALAVLRRNLRDLDLEARARSTRADALVFVDHLDPDAPGFDVALADPPYASMAAESLLARFVRAPFAALLCVEHAPQVLADKAPVWRRQYGDSVLSFFVAPVEGVNGEQ